MGLIPSNGDHMRTYNMMDISLDTWPYAGTTTTCESLYMGVPVVSLRGHCHAQNVGSSLLTAIGHLELIAPSQEGYFEIAVNLAKNSSNLSKFRKKLRQDMEESPLMNGPRYMKEFEKAVVTMVTDFHTEN